MLSKILSVLKLPFNFQLNKKFYRQFIGQYSKFFDIGANVGFKTKVFRSLGVEVIAVEPQASCFNILKTKFNTDAKVKLVNKGISSEKGELKIKISSTSSYISTFSDKWQKEGRFNNYNYDGEQIVSVITFDDLISDYGMPDFVKIDVEGYEYEVIKGLSKKIPCLSFEFTSEFFNDAIKILNHLQDLGFSQYNCGLGEKMSLTLDQWVERDYFIDYLKKQIISNKDLWGDIYAK